MRDDSVSRQNVIDTLLFGKEILSRVLDDMDVVGTDREKYSWGLGLIESTIKDIEELPSAQPNLSEAYSKAVFTWLMDYQIRTAELKGRYTPYEVLSWVINDWRKENG